MMRASEDDKWRIKVLETHVVLSFVALVAGLLIESRPLLWFGALLLALAICAKPAAAALAKMWFRISEFIARFNSMIILTLLYYLILTPMALLYRFFNKDPLDLENERDSFFFLRNHTYSKKDLEKMW